MGVVIWGEGCRCKCGGCDIDLEHIYCKNLTWPHTYDTHAYMLMMWNLCGNDVAPMWWWCANWECIGNICSHVQVSKRAFPCLEVHNIPTCPLLGTRVPMLENIMCSHMGTPCFLSKNFCSIVKEHWMLQAEILLFPHSQHVGSHVGNSQWEHGNKRVPIR